MRAGRPFLKVQKMPSKEEFFKHLEQACLMGQEAADRAAQEAFNDACQSPRKMLNFLHALDDAGLAINSENGYPVD